MPFDPDAYLQQKTAPANNSGFDPDAYLKEKGGAEEQDDPPKDSNSDESDLIEGLKALGRASVKGLVKVGQAVDSIGGAPTRQALDQALSGDFKEAGKSILDPYTKSEEAPTGKEIIQKHFPNTPEKIPANYAPPGVLSDQEAEELGMNFPLKDAAGVAVDAAADRLVFAGPLLKVAKKGLSTLGKFALQGSAKALDVTTGMRTAEKLEDAGTAIQNTSQALQRRFRPKMADDFNDLKKIADRNKIDMGKQPAAIEFGENSSLSRAERVIAEGPEGEMLLQKFKEGQQDITRALDDDIERISGARLPDQVQAGEAIVDGFNEGVKRFFDGVDVSWSQIVKENPGLKVSEQAQKIINRRLNFWEKQAKGKAFGGKLGPRGIGPEVKEAKSLLTAIENIRNANGSLKQTVEALQGVGRVAFNAGKRSEFHPIDIEGLQNIYHKINGELIGSVGQSIGKNTADRLRSNNKLMSNFIGQKSVVGKVVGRKDIAPEKIFKQLVESGDTRKIEALKSILSPEKVNQLKGAFLDSVVKRNAEGDIIFRSTVNNLQRKKHLAQELFTPGEIDNFTDLLKFGERMGSPVMSSSGTGASIGFMDAFKKLPEEVAASAGLEQAKRAARRRSAPPPQSMNPRRKALKLSQVLSIERDAGKNIAQEPDGKSRNIAGGLK